jgi:hypothetical protein
VTYCGSCPSGQFAPATVAPTSAPTVVPTSAPTVEPTDVPTHAPTAAPTAAPTGVCRYVGDVRYDSVLGTIDLDTLAGAKYVDYDMFTIEFTTGCCEACNNRADPGSASYCKGFR